MLAAAAVAGMPTSRAFLVWGPGTWPWGPSVLCSHPSSLQTFEFTRVPAQASLQLPDRAFPQLKLSQMTLAFPGPYPHPGKPPVRDRGPMVPAALLFADLRWSYRSKPSPSSVLVSRSPAQVPTGHSVVLTP